MVRAKFPPQLAADYRVNLSGIRSSGDLQKCPSNFPDTFFFVAVLSKLDHLQPFQNPGNVFFRQIIRVSCDDGNETLAETNLSESILDLPAHPLRTHGIRCDENDHCL